MSKKLKMSPSAKRKLRLGVMKSRKETLYKYISKKNDGRVPCYVCGRHVAIEGHKKELMATIEHILPISKGGTDDLSNLAISHLRCNSLRGNSFSEDDEKGIFDHSVQDITSTAPAFPNKPKNTLQTPE